MKKKITTLVVDDSALMRLLIRDMLSSDPEIEVLDLAKDGKEAIDKIRKFRPDVVTLDLDMPGVDGLEVLKLITKESLARTIVVTGLDSPPEVAYEALNCGAVDFISKPSGPFSVDIDEIKDELVSKVKTAASIALAKVNPAPSKKAGKRGGKPARRLKKVVAIGASTGGPVAIESILSIFPAGLPATILVVQHLPLGFSRTFANRLNSMVNLEVRLAEGREEIKPGVVFVAPSGYHMTVRKKKNGVGVVKLGEDPPVNGSRPSADKLMESVAEVYGKRTIGVILTGMGRDGSRGMQAIKMRGGKTLVQDKKTSVVFSMPKSVIELGCADKVLTLDGITVEIEKELAQQG